MKSSPKKFRAGDLVKIVRIPSDLSDAADIGTPAVFRRALGKRFRIAGFDRYGYVELKVTSRDTIWIEPEFIVAVTRRRAKTDEKI